MSISTISILPRFAALRAIRPICRYSEIAIEPTPSNGLEFPSRIMVDKILTAPKSKLGYRIGQLGERDITRLNQALALFLGLVD